MVEYVGFISDVINRSETILKVGRDKNYDATALLMLMISGFALPYERLSNWGETDPGLHPENTLNRIKKLAKKITAESADDPLREHFSRTNLSKWRRYVLRKDGVSPKDFRREALPRIVDKSLEHDRNWSVKDLMRMMRNALAHGGIHPLSPRQVRSCCNSDASESRVISQVDDKIDRIFLVSRVDTKEDDPKKDIGINIIDVSLPELKNFWYDWKSILLDQIGDEGVATLARAA